MSQIQLVAEKRERVGKGPARQARREGKVPGILYGYGVDPQGIALDAAVLDRFLGTTASTRLLELQVGDETHTVLVKEVQRDPVRGTLLHVDFHRVRLDQEVQAVVPLVVVGEEQRASDGGIVTPNLHELTVSCLPTQIPAAITVDVSGLSLGDTVTVAELELPEGVTVVDDPETAVLSIVAPRTEEPAAEEADEAGVEADDDGAAAEEEDAPAEE